MGIELPEGKNMFDLILREAWHGEAHNAFERYVDERPALDPISAERMKAAFIDGFMAASKPAAPDHSAVRACIPLEPKAIIDLARRLLPYVMAFGRNAHVAPGDMMAALVIAQTTIGRQLHTSLSHVQVADIFHAEAGIILRALDKLESSEGEVKH